MRSFKDEPWVANNSPIAEEGVIANSPDYEDSDEKKHDAEITKLFEDARGELKLVIANTEMKKKQIIVELAKSLEGKVPTESISAEIVSQLVGIVSAGFVRECLDEKYKQKHRVANARKQKKQQREPDLDDDLAKVTTLNQDAEKKDVIVVDAEGRSMLQAEEEDEMDEEEDLDDQSTLIKGSYTAKNMPFSPPEGQQHKEPADTYGYDCLNNNPILEDVEPEEEIEESSKPSDQDKTVDISNHNDKPFVPERDTLNFEFWMLNGDIRKHMSLLYQKVGGDSGKLWFNGKIDLQTGKVVRAGLGRISEQHQGLSTNPAYDL